MTADPHTYVPRPYVDIVRDLLTTLTGGTVREAVVVPAGDVLILDKLANRPIRRVSHLQGEVEIERPVRRNGEIVRKPNGDPEIETVGVPYRFTDTDFELIATGSAPGNQLDAIRFRPGGRRPPVGSTVTVNYYPTQVEPTPALTDLNVGSVTRTMLESVARELAVTELLMEQVYRSAFIDTAEGSNLERVVALVGVTRRPAGVATVRVRFARSDGSTGRITIPSGTIVRDTQGNRYGTAAPLVLEPGEPSREVLAAGVSRSTAAVEAGALTELEVLIAGLGKPTNDAPAAPAAAPETDEDLRTRARGALAVAARGTLEALRAGLLAIEGVKAIAITEFPNGVPGEIAVDVAYEREDDPALEAAVLTRIEELRPAGIRVRSGAAPATDVRVSVALTLAGSGVPKADLPDLQQSVEDRVSALILALPPGGVIRQAPLVMGVLADNRILDASLEMSVGGTPAQTLAAPAGTTLRPVRPFTFTVATETGATEPGTTIQVDALIPLHLAPGVTEADAQAAVTAAAASYLRGLRPGSALTVDALISALRDDTRFAIVRTDVSAVTEAGGRFRQLADGLGAHEMGSADQVLLRSLSLDIREGRV